MHPRPNASWHETDRGATPLGRLLVAPQHGLAPQQARGQSVAMPHALPGSIGFGSMPPGVSQSQRYTGGIAQRQPMSQILPPPDFVGPSYSPASPLTGGGGVLAALAHALGLGGGGGSAPGGGVPAGGNLWGHPPGPQPAGREIGGFRAPSAGPTAPENRSVGGFQAPSAPSAPTNRTVGGFQAPSSFTPQTDLAAALARGRRGAYGV